VCRRKLLFFEKEVLLLIGKLLSWLITSVKKMTLMNTRLYSRNFSFPVFLKLCCV